jgi:hypothetical protein
VRLNSRGETIQELSGGCTAPPFTINYDVDCGDSAAKREGRHFRGGSLGPLGFERARRSEIAFYIRDDLIVQLEHAVERSIGVIPRFARYRGASSPTAVSLGYFGDRPGVVVFELAVILARQVWAAAEREGYVYGPYDVIDELRNLTTQIGSPHTEAVGRELVFYWPTVIIRESD